MIRKVILIGNGPSSKFYSQLNHLDGGMTAGFNLTEHNVDIIFVSDKKVINKLEGNPKVHVLKKPFMTKKGGLNLAWNTGHNAYNYLRKMGYTHFEMYGFDLLFSDNWSSSTDRVFNKDLWVQQAIEVDINNEWIQYWNEIIDTPTIIHAPVGAKLYVNSKHAQIEHHENFNY
jgi:hypothetical protein